MSDFKDRDASFVDIDGWLTWVEAAGGKRRAKCFMDYHGYEGCDAKESRPSAQELFEDFLCKPDELALVVSDHVYGSGRDRYGWAQRDTRVESAVAVAIVCDAAGLVPQGTKIVCCTLADRLQYASLFHQEGWSITHEVGHTARKANEVAQALVAAGARVLCVPEGWGACETSVVDWSPREAKDVVMQAYCGWSGTTALGIPEIPVLANATEAIRQVARMRAADFALVQRKKATKQLRTVFRAFEAPLPCLVEALSFGLVTSEDVTPKSYKVPAWKRALLEPSAQREKDSGSDGESDRIAVAISACATLWDVALWKYLLAPKSFKRKSVAKAKAEDEISEDAYSEVLEGWQQIGCALGIEDALTAVVQDGVSIEDVKSLI